MGRIKWKNHLLLIITSFVVIPVFLSGCLDKKVERPLRIAISKAGPGAHYDNYAQWFKIQDSTIVIFNLYELPEDSALFILETCDGLVLSGGPNMHPGFYGGYINNEVPFTLDLPRDSLEFKLIEKAVELNLPVLGICRGLQIMNVSFGGSLVFDIPTEVKSEIWHKCPDKNNLLINPDMKCH